MRQLAMRFRGLLKGSDPEPLDEWLREAANSGIHGMRRFAATLRRDLAAVRNAISAPWSNGQTEGQINRLKTLKRSTHRPHSLSQTHEKRGRPRSSATRHLAVTLVAREGPMLLVRGADCIDGAPARSEAGPRRIRRFKRPAKSPPLRGACPLAKSPPHPPTSLTGRDHSFDAHPGIDGHFVQWRVGGYRRYRPWSRSDLRVCQNHADPFASAWDPVAATASML